jgi:hypothetical protein
MFCNTAQALPKCEGEDYAQWTNCKGTYLDKDITSPDDEDKFKVTRDFTGEFGSVPGQRQGKGFSKGYRDGNLIITYFGEFKDDKANGQGTGIFPNGGKYVGEYKDGKWHGQGTFTYENGDKYVGEWKNGLFNGQGTYTWLDGRQYVGEWKDDKRHGQGTFIGTDGTVKREIWEKGKLVEPN